jgi:nucleotide-binding universal stress UspA family protein
MSRITHVMVPTDFSEPSDLALEFALDVAARYRAPLLLLHVVEEPNYATLYPDGYFVDVPDLRDRLIQDANERLAKLVQVCADANVAATARVAVGSPRYQIPLEAAAAKIDLIVIGTHGRTGLGHLLLGSVAELIVRSASCPVLTVRSKTRTKDGDGRS